MGIFRVHGRKKNEVFLQNCARFVSLLDCSLTPSGYLDVLITQIINGNGLNVATTISAS